MQWLILLKMAIFPCLLHLESMNTWATRMKDTLLEREDCNVILVDWSPGAKKILYPEAAGNTRLVGAQIAELIRFLISTSSGSPDLAKQFYIVGFSLGAQTAGYAGSYLKARGMTLGRITGWYWEQALPLNYSLKALKISEKKKELDYSS